MKNVIGYNFAISQNPNLGQRTIKKGCFAVGEPTVLLPQSYIGLAKKVESLLDIQ